MQSSGNHSSYSSFGSFHDQNNSAMMTDINVTPMVDVMLVLLVIFILTAPLFTQALQLELPRAQAPAVTAQASTVTIAIDRNNQLFWNKESITLAGLPNKIATYAKQTPQPNIQLRADKSTRYELLTQIMSIAQLQKVDKISFITEPVQ